MAVRRIRALQREDIKPEGTLAGYPSSTGGYRTGKVTAFEYGPRGEEGVIFQEDGQDYKVWRLLVTMALLEEV